MITGRLTQGKFYYVPENTCHADFKVYWYGSCDMWIDYVRVDNQIADELLKGGYYSMYDLWIKEAANSAYINIIAIDPRKFELNNLPCLKYIEKKMKEYTNGRFALICGR